MEAPVQISRQEKQIDAERNMGDMGMKVGINGFGRIGRLVLRLGVERPDIEFVGINSHSQTPDYMAYLLKYDSVHGRFQGQVSWEGDDLIVNGRRIRVFHCEEPHEIPWASVGAEYIVESTGKFTTAEKMKGHLAGGAKKVLLTAPSKDDTPMFVMGVNNTSYDKSMDFVSNASCTTNCLAPVALVLQRSFGIKLGNMVTIHSYTNDQRILDMAHKDLRRARAAACSIIPTSTGAAQAVAKVIPELKGKFSGYSLRVPTPTVSVVDFSGILEKETDTEGLLAALRQAAETDLKGILEYNEKPLVSMDFKGNPASSILESSYTTVQEGHLVKAVAWYDNEWGYSNRVCDLICLMADKGL